MATCASVRQGPSDIPCLVEWGWNDRIQSVKVQNSIGLDAEEPRPVDRIHGTDWIYPGTSFPAYLAHLVLI